MPIARIIAQFARRAEAGSRTGQVLLLARQWAEVARCRARRLTC